MGDSLCYLDMDNLFMQTQLIRHEGWHKYKYEYECIFVIYGQEWCFWIPLNYTNLSLVQNENLKNIISRFFIYNTFNKL